MPDSRLNPALLDEIGRRLYGEHYRPQLAEALGVSTRSLQNWLSAKILIPAGVKADLREIARRRAAEILELVERLE